MRKGQPENTDPTTYSLSRRDLHRAVRTFTAMACGFALWSGPAHAKAQDTATTPGDKSQDTATTPGDKPKTPLISLEVEPSRPSLVAGDGIGVAATVQNVSNEVVYINGNAFTLTLPLELEGSRSAVMGYPAYFPTETYIDGMPAEEYFDKTIAIRPGDRYVAYWTPSTWNFSPESSYILTQIRAQWQYLFFYPGEYQVVAAAKYWTDRALPTDSYGTVTKSTKLNVAAPLFVILFGAALGGAIAYVIFPKRHRRGTARLRSLEPIARHGAGVFGAMLLSVIVTIMLSRIAETRFIISVTVQDVWGAIVIGFVSQYGGTRLIKKLIRAQNDDTSGETKSSGLPKTSAPSSDGQQASQAPTEPQGA